MLQMLGVIPNEVSHESIAVSLRPGNPVVDGRLNIEHGVAVQFSRVHFTNLISSGSRVGSTIHGSENQSFGVQV